MDGTGFDALCLGLHGLEEEDDLVNGYQNGVTDSKANEKDDVTREQKDAEGNTLTVDDNNQDAETGTLSLSSRPETCQIESKKEILSTSSLLVGDVKTSPSVDLIDNEAGRRGGTRAGPLESISQTEAVMRRALVRDGHANNRDQVIPGTIPLVQDEAPAGMSDGGLPTETGQGAKVDLIKKQRHGHSCQNGLGKLGKDAINALGKNKSGMAQHSQRTFKDVGQGSLVYRCSGLRVCCLCYWNGINPFGNS